MIWHNNVLLWLNYFNTLMYGTVASNLNRVQVTQNTTVRAMCPYSESANELCRQFCWLPIHRRIVYELVIKSTRRDPPAIEAYLSLPHRFIYLYIHHKCLSNCYSLHCTTVVNKTFSINIPSVSSAHQQLYNFTLKVKRWSDKLLSTFRHILTRSSACVT